MVLKNRKITGTLMAVGGASMMLIGMSLDLYRFYYYRGILDFGRMFDQPYFRKHFELEYAPNWFGACFPLILIIIFASTVILSVFYYLFTGRRVNYLWGWLGLLSLASLFANYFYLRFSLGVFRAIPYTGWWITFAGALLIVLSMFIVNNSIEKRLNS